MRRLNPTAKPKAAKTRGAGKSAKPQRGGLFGLSLPRVRRRVVFAGGALGVALAVAGLGWVWQSGWIGAFGQKLVKSAEATSAEAGFGVKEILVDGRVRTPRGVVLESLGVHRNDPILALDPTAARKRLEALTWIRSARIERRLPNTLYVALEEREPLALWQLNGELSVLDEQGQVIEGVAPEGFARLPLLVGAGAPEGLDEILALLAAEPALKPLVTAAVRVGERRWNLHLTGGIDVRLPEADPVGAWRVLAELDRNKQLLKRRVSSIDLRLPNRLVVRLAPPEEDTPAAPQVSAGLNPGTDT